MLQYALDSCLCSLLEECGPGIDERIALATVPHNAASTIIISEILCRATFV